MHAMQCVWTDTWRRHRRGTYGFGRVLQAPVVAVVVAEHVRGCWTIEHVSQPFFVDATRHARFDHDAVDNSCGGTANAGRGCGHAAMWRLSMTHHGRG